VVLILKLLHVLQPGPALFVAFAHRYRDGYRQ
jgi:hypothetical protein